MYLEIQWSPVELTTAVLLRKVQGYNLRTRMQKNALQVQVEVHRLSSPQAASADSVGQEQWWPPHRLPRHCPPGLADLPRNAPGVHSHPLEAACHRRLRLHVDPLLVL